jgi:hypothetical protein
MLNEPLSGWRELVVETSAPPSLLMLGTLIWL